MGLNFIYIIEIMEPHNKEKQQLKVFAYFSDKNCNESMKKLYSFFSRRFTII